MPSDTLPTHIAIIMDGNGRWAEQNGYQREQGHERGVESVRKVVSTARELGIETLTLFTFSSENWKRPSLEVSTLFKLFVDALSKHLDELLENGIKLCFIGDIKGLNKQVQLAIAHAEKKTLAQSAMTLNIAINYGGRWDIANACHSILNTRSVAGQGQTPQALAEGLERYFAEHSAGDIDLLIRTGGEYRISNFCLWQSAYAELYFTAKLWPEFAEQDLRDAVQWFAQRERRFGAIPAS